MMSEVTIEDKELERLRRIEDHHRKIKEESDQVAKLTTIYHTKKDAALAAKKNLDEATAKLQELIAEGADNQMRLPVEIPVKPTAAAEPITEGWEAVPVEALGLTKGLTTILKENHCKTIGALEARRKDHGNSLGIDGIGEAKAQKISDAADAWLRNNRDKATFDGAGAVASDAQRGAKLLVGLEAYGQTFPIGTILPVSEIMGNGKVAVAITPDQVAQIESAECRVVLVKEQPITVEILERVPGCDDESDKLIPGFVAKVLNWSDTGNPVVETAAGRPVALADNEWKPAQVGLVEA